MDIRAKLEAIAAMPKNWQAVWIMPDAAQTVRTIRQPTEKQCQSWLDRNVKNHGGEGYVEYMPA